MSDILQTNFQMSFHKENFGILFQISKKKYESGLG